MKEMKCPICGGNIVYDECVDTTFHSNTYFDTIVGNCEKCGQQYLWEEVFKFDRKINLRKGDEN